MWGHIFESFVFAEILKSYYAFRWQTGAQKELSFMMRMAVQNNLCHLCQNWFRNAFASSSWHWARANSRSNCARPKNSNTVLLYPYTASG